MQLKSEVTNSPHEGGADHPQKPHNENKKRDGSRDADDRLRDLPEWLEGEVCLRTEMTRGPYRRRTGEAVPRAEKFGDLITADHKVLNKEGESRNNHRYTVVVQDLATQSIQSYPYKNKDVTGDGKEFTKISWSLRKKPQVIYTDNSLELGKILRRSIMESSNFNTASIRDKWCC